MREIRNILSIDFDYFQKADKEVFSYYPDGIDLPTEISSVVWGTHYVTDGDIIRTVTPDNEKLLEMTDIIGKQDFNTPVMIRQSHVCIYDFILKHYPDFREKLHIVNIDMHHDCFNNNPVIDCGNWIQYIKEYYPECQVDWIANKVSAEVYGIQNLPIQYDFDKIRNMHFDLIFLCRSDNWLPPHLDESFNSLKEFIFAQFHKVLCEESVNSVRNIDAILPELEEQYRQVQNIARHCSKCKAGKIICR